MSDKSSTEKPKSAEAAGTEQAQTASEAKDEKQYPPTKVVVPTVVAVFFIFFLVALDRTIIGTAIPTISSDFNSFDDIAWYESAFLLPLCVLQLSFGLVFKYYPTKWVLFILAAVFEIGSIVCATAPNSNALIAGRAITGIGGAGIGPGSYMLISLLVPLESRPKYLGSLGSAFGISSILGPILGGYFTSFNWRWCFWVNVPIGGVALVLLLTLAPNLTPPDKPAESWKHKFLQLDPVGFVLIGASISCLLFALQLGGDGKWSQGSVIALFTVFAVMLLAFVGYQVWLGEGATIPPRLIKIRAVLVASLLSFCIGSIMVIYAFYLPIWFQVVQGKSPEDSGTSLIPLLLSNVIFVVASGILVSVVGYFAPFSILGGAILVAGAALISTWTVNISEGRWIGYQILTGVGLGMSLQQPIIAIQAALADVDVAIGNSILNFILFLGGTVFVTVAQTLLDQQLTKKLSKIAPNLDPSLLASSGASSLESLVGEDNLDEALVAYNDSMRSIWYLTLALAVIAFLTSFGLEWKNIKAKKPSKDSEASGNKQMTSQRDSDKDNK